jgi:hypothetical protein
MKNIIPLISLIVFLVVVATTCIARTIVNQAKINSRFHHLIQERQINTPPCTYSIGFLTICQNYTYGNMSFCTGYTDY